MKEIDRRCFMSLNRDNRNYHHFIVLVDGYYNTEFWADNDDDAIRIFREEILK